MTGEETDCGSVDNPRSNFLPAPWRPNEEWSSMSGILNFSQPQYGQLLEAKQTNHLLRRDQLRILKTPVLSSPATLGNTQKIRREFFFSCLESQRTTCQQPEAGCC